MGLSKYDPRFARIFTFLGSLSGPFTAGKTFERGNLAHLFVTAVHPSHQGKKLSKTVNFTAMEIARQKNFQGMCCEFTHPWNERGTKPYIESDGYSVKQIGHAQYSPAFDGIDGGANAYIWELEQDGVLKFTEGDAAKALRIKDIEVAARNK